MKRSKMLSTQLIEQRRTAKAPTQEFVKRQDIFQPFAYLLGKKQVVVWAASKFDADKMFSELQLEKAQPLIQSKYKGISYAT